MSGSIATHSGVYTDLHGLQSLKNSGDPNDPETLRAVAKQFESLMINMMLKSMRDANAVFEEGSLFNSNETKFFREMFDNQISVEMAEGRGIGLTEVLVRQLSGKGGVNDTLSRGARSLMESGNAANEPDPPADGDDALESGKGEAAALWQRTVDGAVRSVEALRDEATTEILDFVETLPGLGHAHFQESDTDSEDQDDGGVLPGMLRAIDQAASAINSFRSPAEFVSKLYPLAEHAAGKIGLNPRFLLAQAALETGWGKHVIPDGEGGSTFNLFGIKADSRWDGASAAVDSLEFTNGVAEKVRSAFRSYQSYAQSFLDYVRFIEDNPRYRQALEQVADPKAYADALQDAGYATDPNYANKIKRILDGDVLGAALGELK